MNVPSPIPAGADAVPDGTGAGDGTGSGHAGDRRGDLAVPRHDCSAPAHRALFALLRIEDIDAAIDCGLVDFAPCPACAAHLPGYAADARDAVDRRDQLLAAWAARDRYRAREARLARRDERRAQRRAAVSTRAGTPTSLPPAAAAALARARARAASSGTP